MKKLNQILAVEKSIKGRAESVLQTATVTAQQEQLLNGFHKTYQPVAEDGAQRAPESLKVQHTAKELYSTVAKVLGELFNTTAAKDLANCSAKANVTVGGQVLLSGVPSTYLLFLDKQLTTLSSFVARTVELKSDTDWSMDPNSGLFRSGEIRTQVAQKVQEVLVKYQATVQHPAQTEIVSKDVLVGHWTTTKLSGALPKPLKQEILERIQELQLAVKEALEEANGSVEVPENDFGAKVFNHIFKGVI